MSSSMHGTKSLRPIWRDLPAIVNLEIPLARTDVETTLAQLAKFAGWLLRTWEVKLVMDRNMFSSNINFEWESDDPLGSLS